MSLEIILRIFQALKRSVQPDKMHNIDFLSPHRCSEVPSHHDIYDDRFNNRLYHWLYCGKYYRMDNRGVVSDADVGDKAKLMSKDPPIAVWHPYDPKYDGKVVCSCAKLAIINSSFQAFFDIIILLIPIPIFKILKPNYNLRGAQKNIYILYKPFVFRLLT